MQRLIPTNHYVTLADARRQVRPQYLRDDATAFSWRMRCMIQDETIVIGKEPELEEGQTLRIEGGRYMIVDGYASREVDSPMSKFAACKPNNVGV